MGTSNETPAHMSHPAVLHPGGKEGGREGGGREGERREGGREERGRERGERERGREGGREGGRRECNDKHNTHTLLQGICVLAHDAYKESTLVWVIVEEDENKCSRNHVARFKLDIVNNSNDTVVDCHCCR